MSTNYPNAQDAFPVHVDNNGEKITATDMNNAQDAISALEQTVGSGATAPTDAATPSALMKRDANGVSNLNALGVAGLTGATSASRYVGATASGAPTSGTFAVGDWCVDIANAMIWTCETAGAPGTWTSRTNVDTWHQPTLLNGWVNFGSGNAVAAYRKDAGGFVHIKGLIESGTTNNSAFTLPVGYRPLEHHYFPCASTESYGEIKVASTGDVIPTKIGTTWIGIECCFLAEQ